MERKILFTILVFLFFSNQKTFALDLNVIVTNETCTGNGLLAFSVTNQTSGVPVFYAIYLLPNTTTPLVTTTLSTYGGLVSGNYLVIATQTVGSTTTSTQQNVIILNQIVALNYTISFESVKCGNDGQITVNVTSGNPVSYQLLLGPVTTGIQTNNVFSNLPAGQYNIRVFDNCGEGLVQTFTLTSLVSSLNIGAPNISSSGTPNCDFINVFHILTPTANTQIFFPITVQVTAYPPSGGSPIITNQTLTASPLIMDIPSISGVGFQYDILITDACGNQYIRNNNVISQVLNFGVDQFLENCNDYFIKFTLTNHIQPFTVNFISAPTGFNPVLANPNHPGYFTGNTVIYGGSSYYMPLGNYTVQITDSCGKTRTRNFTVQNTPSIPVSIITQGGCGVGANLSISLNLPRLLGTVILTSAPSSYPNSLPDNLSSLIVNGVFYFQNIPFGTYQFSLTDICGNPYTYLVVIAGNPEVPIKSQRPGCNIGDGSIQIYFNLNPPNPTTTIVSVEIQEARVAFAFPLPFNANINITSSGVFSMNSLPEGNYKFKIIDSCGIESIVQESITGFTIVSSTYSLTENCGSFNLQLKHNSKGSYLTSYHLQKYNPFDNVWEHASTGFDYVPGSALTTTNSLTVLNNTNNLNLAFSGTFRILKVFYNYSNGTTFLNRCIIPIHEFDFTGGPKIIDAFAFPCANNTQEVVIIATGLPPLNYKITTKNGLPFIINNGVSNIFAGLDSASYNFEVIDVCGNVVNRVYDVSLLEEPQIVASNLCNGQNGQLEIQNFPFVTYQWYNIQSPTVILSTSNILSFTPFTNANNFGTYAVQLSTTNTNSCINQIIEYTINSSGSSPNAGNDSNISICKENTSISLNTFLSNPHDSGGTWTDSNGNSLTSGLINLNDYTVGNYTFIYTVTGFCAVSDSAIINITIKDLPATPILSTQSTVCFGNDVLLEANAISNATYFWTGPNGFTSTDQNPLIQNFTSINNGTYFAYVSIDGCNSETEQVVINANPLPDFTIEGVSSICIGNDETLTINPINFDVNSVAIEWYFNGILLNIQTNPILIINQIGTYTVSINNSGCIENKDFEVIEKINSFDVQLEHGCNGNNYEINITNSSTFPNAMFAWSGPNNFSSSSQNIIVPNLEIGLYNIEVTDVFGCKSNTSVLVESTNCFIPNAFSPDEDGSNDSFDLSGYDVKKIQIYNRYGRLVYEKENYINEWKGQTNNNNKLPASTYFYILEFQNSEKKTGWVYVTY